MADDAVVMLSVDDVIDIYSIIVDDFAASDDPISPAGVRDNGLLESAVYRQQAGFEGRLKYPHPVSNAASLAYGLCCDHPFYNGNKRAALVSMLVHLDRNGLTLLKVGQADLFDLMIDVADHRLGVRRDDRHGGSRRVTPDEEVQALYKWLRERAHRIEHGERVITYRQLRTALAQFGIAVEIVEGNRADLVRYEDRRVGMFRQRVERARVRIGTIGYRDEGTDIPKAELKKIRAMCKLTEENGVDSRAFYSTGVVVDAFICRYRRALQRLAKA